MAFDDRNMDLLNVIALSSIVVGLAAPVVGRFFGWWWAAALYAFLIAIWVLLGWLWRNE